MTAIDRRGTGAPTVAKAHGPTTPGVDGDAAREATFHRYASSRIPWWVRAMWIGYWIFTIYYVSRFLIPMVREYY